MDIGTLTGYLELEDRLSPGLALASRNLQSFGSSTLQAGTALTAGLTVPLTAAAGFAVKTAIDFESSFAGVRKTLDATEPQFEQLQQSFRDLAQEIPVSVNEINRVAEAGGQLGVKVADIEGFTRTMVNMGVATNLSSDEAATGLARIANIINNEAGPQYDKLGATIVDLGNNSATTEAEIVQFALRLASAGKVAGLSEPDILAMGAALSSVGIEAEAGGSAFSKLFVQITNAVQTGNEDLTAFASTAGMTADEFTQSFATDAAGAITSFVEGLGRIDREGGNVFATLENLGITEVRMRNALLASAGAGDLLSRSIELANVQWGTANALTDEAAERYKTVESQLTILWNRVKDVAITFGDALLPTLLDATMAAKPLIDVVALAAEGFGSLPKPVRTTAIVLAGLVAAVGPVLVAVGLMSQGLAATIPLWPVVTSGVKAFGRGALATAGYMTTYTTQAGYATTATWALSTAMKALLLIGVVVFLQKVADGLTGWATEARKALEVTGQLETKSGRMKALWLDLAVIAANPWRAALNGAQALLEETGLVEKELGSITDRMGDASTAADVLANSGEDLTEQFFKNAAATVESAEAQKTATEAAKALTDAQKAQEERIQSLVKTWQDGDESLRDVATAFSRLTPEVMATDDVVRRLAPVVQTLRDAHVELTPEMLRVEAAAQLLKASEHALGLESLATRQVTIEQVDALGELGLEQQDVANIYNVSVSALEAYLEQQRQAIDATKKLSDAMDQWTQSMLQSGSGLEQLLAVGRAHIENINELAEAQLDYAQLNKELLLSGTELELEQLRVRREKALADLGERTKATAEAWDAAAKEVDEYFDHLERKAQEGMSALAKFDSAIGRLAKSFEQLANISGGRLGEVASAIGNVLGAINLAAEAAETMAGAFEEGGGGWATFAAGAIGAVGALDQATNSSSKAVNAIGGAATGARIGMAFGPWGAAIGAIGGAMFGFIKSMNAGRRAIEEFAESFDTVAEGSGFDELHRELQRLGASGEEMWIDLTQGTAAGNAEEAQRKIEAIQAALAALDADIQKYNLTWADMVDAQMGATVAAEELIASYERLTEAGFASDAVITAMSEDLNQLIIDAVETGTKIPAAMQPILESLISMGLLTDEAAAAMLGLEQDSVPSLDDITAAAERYGIKLGSLGPKVRDLRITELAVQYVSDWDTLTAVTKNWGVVIDAMRPKVQSLVLDAIKYGTELPAGMEPMLQAFIDAGALVDANGRKLTSLEGLTFAQTLEEKFQTLIDKLGELIDAIGDVDRDLSDLPSKTTVEIHTKYTSSGESDERGRGSRNMAGGGVVYANSGFFAPMGSDVVPAMLTPGERVLTVSEAKEHERDRSDTDAEPTLEAINGLRHDINTKLPRSLARAIQSEFVAFRAAS